MTDIPEIIKTLPGETINKAYDDLIHPAASEAGKTLGILAHAITAALSPLEIWSLNKEYNVKQIKAELEKSLSSVDPEKIISPEPYVAVPAIEAISYSINNKELCALYANLLAKSMISDTKDKVHPAFVEIIKQLSPNDALIFKECSTRNIIPAAKLSIIMIQKGLHMSGSAPLQQLALDLVADISFSFISEEQVRVSLDNLIRTGLLQLNNFSLEDATSYNFIKSSDVYLKLTERFHELNAIEPTADHIHIDRKCISVTALGNLFREICIDGF